MVPPTSPAPASSDVRMVFVTAPPDRATLLARALVEERLAACVNVVPGLRSIFRWKGEVLDEPETLLLAKTVHAQVAALTARVLELHPADVPEVLVVAPTDGLEAYLAWVASAVGEAPESPVSRA